MECDLAREALSARIDGEREPVPSARVDEHVEQCADCNTWFAEASRQADALRRLANPLVVAAQPPPRNARGSRATVFGWARWGLIGVGVAQIAIAVAQAAGLGVGLTHANGMHSGGHLLNESTAWSMTLGLVMVVAAIWPGFAAGLAATLTVYAGVLSAYVIADAIAGNVTVERITSHLPIVVGAVLAILVWRKHSPRQPSPATVASEPEIVLPHNASRGQRRGHLWPTDGSAA